MKEDPESSFSSITGLRPYLIAAAAIIISYILFTLILHLSEETTRILMISGVLLCGVFFAARCLSKRRVSRAEALITALIAAGVVMRVGYMLYTSFFIRAHDIGKLALDGTGNFAYMYGLYSSGTLPQTYEGLLYHPPLQFIVQAFVVKVFSWFQNTEDTIVLFQASKIVPCFAMCALLIVGRRICEETGLSKRTAAIAVAIIAFQPTFFILSASVNNDALMLLFFMTTVLYTIRWYKNQSIKNILFIALATGLAMMAKLSGVIVALFTVPVFLAVLIKRLREKKAKKLIGQFAAFTVVSIPLGLWYSVRNAVLFGQPLGYILHFSENHLLYCGGNTPVERFFSFPLGNIINPLYCDPFVDFNIWIYTLKCSVFGEFKFDAPEALAALLIIANLILILFSLAAMVYVMLRCKGVNKFARFGLFWIWLTQIVSFIIFNIRFPFGCTMDFRYIVPTAIVGAVYTGIALDHIRNKHKIAADVIFIFGCAAVAFFGAASVLFYAA
jgi:hypothetical protein